MKNLFIVNPVSGKGHSLKFIAEIKDHFKSSGESYKIEYTKYKKHATELSEFYSKKRVERIFSIGGDGTLNEVLNGMMNSNSVLGVIPAGSGNDFFRTLTSGVNSQNIISRTINGTEKYTDVGIVNSTYFINIASVGFDAQVAHTSDYLIRNSIFGGSLAYYISILLTLVENNSYDLKISFDDSGHVNKQLTLIAVANGKFYGSGIMAAPKADIYDGEFDVCSAISMNRIKILKFFPRYKKGNHSDIKEVSFTNCKKLIIESNEEFPLNIDGEVGLTCKAEISIIPKAIKIIIPKLL